MWSAVIIAVLLVIWAIRSTRERKEEDEIDNGGGYHSLWEKNFAGIESVASVSRSAGGGRESVPLSTDSPEQSTSVGEADWVDDAIIELGEPISGPPRKTEPFPYNAELQRRVYAHLLNEKKDEATKLQALVESDGDREKAKVLYYKLRYQQIIESGEIERFKDEVFTERASGNGKADHTSVSKKAPGQGLVQGPGADSEIVMKEMGYRMVYIPPGTFVMGSPEGEPGREVDEMGHQVTLTRGFYMGVTQVTQGQWKRVMGGNPSRFKRRRLDYPLESVSWLEAQEFIEKLNRKQGKGKYRLPTEAEWEYACRAGTVGAYSGDLDEMAWYDKNAAGKTHLVGRKRPNAWGLYDMHGNVYEWCEDWYGEYPSGKVKDPTGPASGSLRVARGGSWTSPGKSARSANRFSREPKLKDDILGFRLVSEE